MERGEPSLVPEWLRSSTGGGAGVGSSNHHLAALQADRSSSSNTRRTSSSNGSTKHDRNSYSRPYRSFNRSHCDKDRERLTITNNWDLEYSDPLRSMISGRTEGSLRRSQSMISGRQGTRTAGTKVTGIKVSFERDFPHLGNDGRPKTPDIVTVSSPSLSRSINIMSTCNSPLIGSEGWTSALAEVPTAPQPSPAASGSSSSGLNMAEALVQTAARSQNIPQPSAQSQRDELAIAQSKKLIPMTPSLPKPLVNQSDKLKPKTPGRSNEATIVPKNGSHQLPPLQLGLQSTRGTIPRLEGPKSPGKLLVLKPGRDNGGPTITNNVQTQTTTINSNRSPNNQSVATNPRVPPPCFGSKGGAEKRNFQSRSEFFNMMRKKSMNRTSVTTTNSCSDADMMDKTDEPKERSCVSGGNGSKAVCSNREACEEVESCSQSEDESAGIYPNEEEKAFLRSLGWEENAADDEALTEEEINAFYQEVWRLRATSELCRDHWPKSLSHFEMGPACPTATSSEPTASASRN